MAERRRPISQGLQSERAQRSREFAGVFGDDASPLPASEDPAIPEDAYQWNALRSEDFNDRPRGRRVPRRRMKKGGKVTMPKHTDEAMDRALIRKELSKAKSAGKMKSGGAVKTAKYARGGGVEIKGKIKGRMA